MHYQTFRETIKTFIDQNNDQWIFFGDAHMSSDHLSYSDLDFLVDAVEYYRPTSLGLANMNLSDEQMKYLAPQLKTLDHLNLLYFAFNNIGDKGADALADLLCTNKNIKELILLRNKISDKGMLSLAGMLCTNTSLTKLELFDNPCSEKSTAYFTEALQRNHVIKTLLLYPGTDGIHITKRQVGHHQEIMLKRKHRMMLMNVNKPLEDEKSGFRKLITRHL